MKTITYKNSWVKFCDCIEGMKELEDKSIDLCLTDPPYNINAKPHQQRRDKNKIATDIGYTDYRENYYEWSLQWFTEARRISKKLLFTCGQSNQFMFYTFEEPKDILYHYKCNGNGLTSITWHNRLEPILVYGEFDTLKKPFLSNVFSIPLLNGFLREDIGFIHPHPKSPKLWFELIKGIHPSSVLDPFMGSGTTLEACIQLGIPCYGFELMEEYRPDMEKRIERSKYYRRPVKLDSWFEVDDTDLQNEMNSKSEI